MPPSITELEKRLNNRGTETEESLKKRIDRAEMEIDMAKDFDKVIINDNLNKAVEEMKAVIKQYTK